MSTYNVSETVGYASLSQIAKAHGSDLEALSDFLTDIPDIVDIMGEDAEPGDDKRLLWDSVSDLIDKRLLKTLVVSCLYDIAGTDTQKLARFLAKLNENHVRLQVMKENLDTSRQTSRQIIEHAKLVFATAERLKLSPLKTDLI